MKAGVSIGYVVSVVNLGEVFFFFFLKMVPVVEGNLRATNERSSDASEKFV